MSKRQSYRGAADTNPVQLDSQPREKLETAFPLREDAALQRDRAIKLVGVWLASSMMLTSIPAMMMTIDTGLMVLVLPVFCLIAFAAGRSIDRRDLFVYGTAGFGVLLSGLPFSFAIHGGYLVSSYLVCLLLTMVLCMVLGFTFRWNWIAFCCCGLTPRRIRNRFRRWPHHLPRGLKPKRGGFINSLVNFVTYNSWDVRTPGIYRSALPVAIRQSLIVLTLCMLSGLFMPIAFALFIAGSPHRPILREAVEDVFGSSPVLNDSALDAFLFGFMPPFVFVVAMPTIIVMGVLFLFSFGIANKGYALRTRQFTPHHWPHFIDDLQTSNNEAERESIYLARVDADHSPLLIPTTALWAPWWITGSPGGGKTQLSCQLVEQLVAMGISVVTIDCKGTSNELLWSATAAADRVLKRDGRVVQIDPFTTVTGLPTRLINVFDQPFWGHRSPEERASGILGYFGLNYPDVYGQSYYRDTAWAVLQLVSSKYPDAASFHDLHQRTVEVLQYAQEPHELSAKTKRDGEHPRFNLHRLGLIDAVNMRQTYDSSITNSAINLERLFCEPSVLHCKLPAEIDPIGNPEVARVILAALFSTATNMSHRPVPVVVIIDEWQRMVSRSLDLVMQQARSNDIGLVFTNQTVNDLMLPGFNMAETLLGNSGVQIFTRTTDIAGRRMLQELGGDYIDEMQTRGTRNGSNGPELTYSYSEQLLPRISSGLIDHVNAVQEKFFVRINSNAGYSAYGGQMFVARSDFHITKSEHSKRSQTRRWVDPAPGMLINGQHRPNTNPPSSGLTGPQPTPTPNRPSRSPTALNPKRRWGA